MQMSVWMSCPIVLPHRPAVNNLSIMDCEPLSSKTRLAPLQCNSARYTSALKYQGESHHSLRSIDPAPNPTLRQINGDIFFIADKSLAGTQHVNAVITAHHNIIYIYIYITLICIYLCRLRFMQYWKYFQINLSMYMYECVCIMCH